MATANDGTFDSFESVAKIGSRCKSTVKNGGAFPFKRRPIRRSASMTATRTLAKKRRKFSEKAFAKGKKLKTRFQRTKVEKRVFSEHSGEDRSGLAPDSLLRESCDPPPASSKSRRSRSRTRKARRGRRRRSRSKLNRPSGGARRSEEREQTSFLLLSTLKICQRGRRAIGRRSRSEANVSASRIKTPVRGRGRF